MQRVVSAAGFVAFSGGKAIRGPHGFGILAGRRDLIDSVRLQTLDLDVDVVAWAAREGDEPHHGLAPEPVAAADRAHVEAARGASPAPGPRNDRLDARRRDHRRRDGRRAAAGERGAGRRPHRLGRRERAPRNGDRRDRARRRARLRRHPLAPRLDRAAPARAELVAPNVLQGITTAVAGNCGISPAPLAAPFRGGAVERMPVVGLVAGELGWSWRTVAEYLREIERAGACR